MSIEVKRVIRTVPGYARLRRIVSTTSRWDLLLAIIPFAFASAATVSRALGIPFEAGMTLAGVVGSLAARDALIAGCALVNDDRLAVADDDFDVPGITEVLEVDFL